MEAIGVLYSRFLHYLYSFKEIPTTPTFGVLLVTCIPKVTKAIHSFLHVGPLSSTNTLVLQPVAFSSSPSFKEMETKKE